MLQCDKICAHFSRGYIGNITGDGSDADDGVFMCCCYIVFFVLQNFHAIIQRDERVNENWIYH